jgi:hypothetical protein
MPDPTILSEANIRATTHFRTLRRVGELMPYDMTVYEDTLTGDRRKLPNKSILMYGTAVAFELAEPSALPEETETE